MKTAAYLRVSTEGQDLDNQRLAILDFAHRTAKPDESALALPLAFRATMTPCGPRNRRSVSSPSTTGSPQ